MLIDHFILPADPIAQAPQAPSSQAVIVGHPDPAAVEMALKVEQAAKSVEVKEASDTLTAEAEHLDLICQMVEAANTQGGLSTESLVFLHLSVSRLQERLGLAGTLVDLSALECHQRSQRTPVCTDQLRKTHDHLMRSLQQLSEATETK